MTKFPDLRTRDKVSTDRGTVRVGEHSHLVSSCNCYRKWFVVFFIIVGVGEFEYLGKKICFSAVSMTEGIE